MVELKESAEQLRIETLEALATEFGLQYESVEMLAELHAIDDDLDALAAILESGVF